MRADESRFLARHIPVCKKGYHMNDKASWNTVIMDGGVPWDVLEEMIGDSYDLIKPKVKKQTPE